MNNYDEDLKQNPFYKKLVDYQTGAEHAFKSDWIICIPRVGTLLEPILESDIKEHILVPNGSASCYTSLNRVPVLVENDEIKVEGRDYHLHGTRILFKETFYHKHLRYKVYCIEFPLSRNCAQSKPITVIANLRDCIDFLWIETFGRDVLKTIGEHCRGFQARHRAEAPRTTETMQDSIRCLYQMCLMEPLACAALRQKVARDATLERNLRIATETLMQHALDNCIFMQICELTADQDASFNKVARNVQEIHVKHFQISAYHDRIPAARSELGKINKYATTLGKMRCMQAAFRILAGNDVQYPIAKNRVLNADTLIQLFAFLVIKLNVHNWLANLIYMRDFVFSHSAHDEDAYLVTTLEAAIEVVKSPQLPAKLNSDIDSSPNSLLIAIRNCNTKQLERMLCETPSGETSPKLCHPLCSCDRCEQMLADTRQINDTLLQFLDEKGRNCLHLACMYGHPQVVDLLLRKSGANLSTSDYSGAFPIHYAAQRGHLNALLLLLHAGVDLNATNADGNTALHLAANNGHENCVNGLAYFCEHTNSLHINARNAWGESALHLASRWGYTTIVGILLEHGIDWRIRNKRNEDALYLASNIRIKQLIRSVSKEGNEPDREPQYDLTIPSDRFPSQTDFACNSEDAKCYGIRPKNFEQFKKTDLLLKAIEINDLPLSCFHLGIPLSANVNNNCDLQSESSCHHPLCDCSSCGNLEHAPVANVGSQGKLNVNICNSEGFTSLHVAAQFGRTEILRLLLDAGGNCNLQTYKSFYTPLHLACINQRLLAIKELLLSGSCNIDMQDSDGNTGLHYACGTNDLRIVDVLVTKGALTTIRNNKGHTALRLAQETCLLPIEKLIREKSRQKCSTFESLLE